MTRPLYPTMLFIACFLAAIQFSVANEPELNAGPMLGYTDMFEAKVWLQTVNEQSVEIHYHKKGDNDVVLYSEPVETKRKNAYTALFTLDRLEPGTTYNYHVVLDGKKLDFEYATELQTQKLWQHRENPPAFSIALGSCSYTNDSAYDRPGQPYGGDYHIYESIAAQKPDLMLWLGDNVYFREPDWNTFSGMAYRYSHWRKMPEMQKLMASCNHLAIWDDHDFGPNDADGSFWNKETALNVFKLFWANPSYGFKDMPGVMTVVQWNDVDLFLLDNRYYRTSNKRKTGTRQILGKKQLNWLINALSFSKAPFKLVCIGGQVLNPVAKWENYANYNEERAELLREIEQNQINGVVFLSGDKHHTDVSTMKRRGTYPLNEITVSPLTSGTYGKSSEPNYHRVEGTSVGQRNFAILNFDGPLEERTMLITVFDSRGEKLISHNLNAVDLRR